MCPFGLYAAVGTSAMLDQAQNCLGEGDVVEVYGPHNSVNEAARLAGTISYELTCAVSKRVPRIYYRHGKEIARELLLRG